MMRYPFQEIENRIDKNELDRESFRLKQEVLMLADTSQNQNSEISRLKTIIAQLDNDKDKLLNTIDEKTVENVKLRREINNCTQINDNLNEQLNQMNRIMDKTSSQLEISTNELNNLKLDSQYLRMENSQLKERIESDQKESKQLQDDLVTITRENQVLHAELEKHNCDKNSLKQQIQEYMQQMSKLNDLIEAHEEEKNGLKNSIAQLNNQFDLTQNKLNEFENEKFSLRMELQLRSLDVKRLKDKLECLEKEFAKKICECQDYEVKLSVSARNLQRSEDQLKKLRSELKELMRDMVNFRDLNTRLEQAKDDLSRQLTKKDLDYDALRNKFEDVSAENELLKSHLSGERTMIKQLEDLIASNREKDYKTQLNSQRNVSEAKLLKDRIDLGEQKLIALNKQIDRLKAKICELEAENDILKRQLYNVKFDTVVSRKSTN